MRRAAAIGVAMLVVAGCGGGSSSTGTGGHGGAGATGAGGQGNGAGASGVGGAGAAGGLSGGLPTCAVTAKPNDPDAGVCNSIAITGANIVPEPVTGTTNGIVLDGGAVEGPMGGTILDGDYDLVRWQDNVTGATRRTMRVFGGGKYIEWAGVDVGFAQNGGDLNFRYDATEMVNGTSLVVVHENCTDGTPADDFGFTATGDDLVLFNSVGGGGSVAAVDTYRRTCTRP